MDNKIYKTKEFEIDLKAFFCKVLMQWKALLIVSLITACIFCGAKHIKDVQTYHNQQIAQKQAAEMAALPKNEQVEKVLSTLPENERSTVEAIVNEKEWIASQKSYAAESVIMKTDPTNQRVLKIVFDIDADQDNDLPVILHNYEAFLSSNEVVDAIRPFIDPEADSKYINELFYTTEEQRVTLVSEGNTAALEECIILLEDTDEKAVCDAINKVVTKHSNEMQSQYRHSIAIAETSVQHVYNKDNVEKRNDTFNTIYNLETFLKTNETSLSEGQKAAIESILNIKNTAPEDINEVTITVPGWSKRFAFLGLLFGLFVYAGIIVIKMIIRAGINSSSDAVNYSNLRLVGEVYYERENRVARFFLHSKFFEKFFYKDKIDPAKQISKLTESLSTLCKHVGSKKLLLLELEDCGGEGKYSEIMNSIAMQLENKGLDVIRTSTKNGIDERCLLEVNNGVLFAREGTGIKEIEKTISTCMGYDLKLLGCSYIAEI